MIVRSSAGTSCSAPSQVPSHRRAPVATPSSRRSIRTRWPVRRTLPARIASTPSRRAAAAGSVARRASAATVVRERTRSARVRAICAVRPSVIPSPRYASAERARRIREREHDERAHRRLHRRARRGRPEGERDGDAGRRGRPRGDRAPPPRPGRGPDRLEGAPCTSSADWKRRSGARARQRSTTRASPAGTVAGSGSRGAPVPLVRGASMRCRTAPSANTSARASLGRPSTCSGATYPGVPITVLGSRRRGGPARRPEGQGLRDPEVEELDAALAGQEDVVGLEVAVHEALRVHGREAPRDLDPERDRLRRVDGPAPQAPAERLALQELGDDERHAVRLADVEHGDHVRIADRGRRPRLRGQPRARVAAGAPVQHLQRDVAAQAMVAGAVDLAHAAGVEQLDHLVGAHARAGGERRPLVEPERRERRAIDRLARLEEVGRLLERRQQVPHGALERPVPGAAGGQPGVALGGGALEGPREHVLHLLPLGRRLVRGALHERRRGKSAPRRRKERQPSRFSRTACRMASMATPTFAS